MDLRIKDLKKNPLTLDKSIIFPKSDLKDPLNPFLSLERKKYMCLQQQQQIGPFYHHAIFHILKSNFSGQICQQQKFKTLLEALPKICDWTVISSYLENKPTPHPPPKNNKLDMTHFQL